MVVLSEVHGADGSAICWTAMDMLIVQVKDRPGRTGSQMIFQHITVIGIFLLIVIGMLVWSQREMDGRDNDDKPNNGVHNVRK